MKSFKSISKIFLPIGIIIILFLLVLFVFKPLYGEINKRINVLKTELITQAEELIGRPISYESISPSIFRVIEIRNLKIHGKASEDNEILTIKKVRIYYNLLTLLFKDPAESFRQVKIEDTQLALNTEKDTELIRTLEKLFKNSYKPDSGNEPIKKAFTISGNNLSILLNSPKGNGAVEKLFFKLRLSPETINMEGKGQFSGSLFLDPLGPMQAGGNIELSGKAGPDFSWTNISLSLREIESNLFKIADQSYDLDFKKDGNIILRKIGDDLPIDLELLINTKEKKGTARFHSEGFIPSDLITFRGILDPLNPWLDTVLTGSGEASIKQDEGVVYSVNFEESALAVKALPQDSPINDQYVFSGKIKGNEEKAQIDNLKIVSSAGTLNYTGTIEFKEFDPRGTLTLKDVKIDNYPALTAVIDVSKTKKTYIGHIESFNYGEIPIPSLSFAITPTVEDISLEVQGSIGDKNNETKIEGVFVPKEQMLSLSGSIKHLRSEQISNFAMLINKEMDIPSLPTSLENSRISLDFKVTGLPEDIDLKVPSLFFYNPGNTNQNAHLSVDYRRGQLIIDTIEVNWNDLQLKGEAGAEISKDKINIFSDFTLRDIPYSITGTYIPEQELTITGLHGVKATLSLGRGQEIFFQLYGTDVPIPLGEEESYVTAEIFGVFYSSTNYELRINKFVLNDLPAVPFDESYISLSGNITNDKADLNQITFSDGISNLDGSGTISYSLEKNYSVTGSFHLIGQKEDESLTADFEIIPGTTKLKGEMRNLLVSRLGQEEITGLLDGKLAYEKGSGEPQIVTDFLLKKGSYKDSPISGEGKLEYVQKHLKIYEGSFNLVNHRFREGTLSYNFDTGQISGAVNYTGNLGGENLELESKFNGSLSPIDSLPSISQSIKSPFEINAVVQGVPFGDQENNVWNIFAKKEIESITFKGGPQECINGNIRDNGDFRITLSDRLPINFESEGKLKGSEIEANLNRISLDIQSISSYLNLGFIQFLTGNTSGSLRVTGPINDPDFYGTVTVSDATADLAIFPDIVGPSSFNLVFQEKTLNLNRFKTTVDNRAGYIEGTFIIEHWTPGEFRLFIESEERQGLNVVYNFGGLTVDGYATGTLSISGNRSYILLDGDITANSTIMTVGETQTSGGGEEPYDLYLDLTLRSGRGVEFLWPSRNFPILRSFAELNQKLHITYESLTESFKVTGDIGIKGGEIFYFQRSFFIKDGNISFNEDESAFDPMLSARAEIREATSEGTAKIDLIIDESPLSEFSPRFESDPPMSDAEIAALLGGNLFSDYEGSNELSSALFLTSDIIGQFGIMRNFERTLRNALNLDLFSIRTHLFENVVRGFINESNHLDKDVPSLGKYLDNTTLFLGKYIGSDLFLEMLIQLKTNQFQAGYRTFSGLQIDSEFSLEWKTPFFLLEWEFLPRNPESLFITDNILSFSWKFSY